MDTQCFLWMQAEPGRFNPEALARIEDPESVLLLSAASAWEIAIKHSIGKLPLPEPPDVYLPSRMRHSAVDPLPVTTAHALGVAALPFHHRDPFDRLLVAQAGLEGLPLMTADAALEPYGVELLRAD